MRGPTYPFAVVDELSGLQAWLPDDRQWTTPDGIYWRLAQRSKPRQKTRGWKKARRRNRKLKRQRGWCAKPGDGFFGVDRSYKHNRLAGYRA